MRIRLIAFGCSNNIAESEIMAGLLKEQGHSIVESGEELSIISICSVKGPSFNKGVKEAKKAKGKVIFSGCIPEYKLEKLRKDFPSASIVSTRSIAMICSAAEEISKGNRVEIIEQKSEKKLCMPRVRKNKAIGIIPISSGCLGQCSYCAVKAIKGNLVSYPIEDIVKEAKQCIKEGCREIWLTAQDTGCYGLDIGSDLPSLLKKVCEVEGDFKIRLGMANPRFVKQFADGLIECYKNPKMFRFLHIPLQSGSNKVLNDMNRQYTAEEFISLVDKFREAIPDITISTDIIVGYPSETQADFEESISVIEKVKPEVLNLNRYWAMPGTIGAKMKQLKSEVLKDRSLNMLKVFKGIAFENNQKAVGKTFDVLVDEIGKDNSFMARTDSYRPVAVKGKYTLGQRINVKIKKANANYLQGS